MKLAIGISTLALVVAMVALAMVLWPIVSEAPWEENDWTTLTAPDPKEVTSPPLVNPDGQPTLGGEIFRLNNCLSGYRSHTHSYSRTDVSHSHDLQRSLWGDSYSISQYRPWTLSMTEKTSGPKNFGLGFEILGC